MIRQAFTVEQANALLPHVRATFRRIHAGREAARRRVDKMAVLHALWGDAVNDPDNHDHDEMVAHERALQRIGRAIERLVRDRLTDRGIRLPSGGLDHGLVDFPTTLDGRWVYLCWHAGEDTIGFWHEIDSGFAGRRPITAELAARIAAEDDPALEDDSVLDF
ncbi:MAG: DUF2203 domain-containing protein [Gemmatimonadota bacterium]|nr:DUF2203 domain-containing protein [Gemmatimonadota bacterium]